MLSRVALALLFTTSLSAATADLRVTIDAPSVVKPGEPFTSTASVENLGPDTATAVNVVYGIGGSTCFSDHTLTFAPGERRNFTCTRTLNAPNYQVQATITTYAAETDPDRTNNGAFKTIDLASDPDLYVWVDAPRATPGLPNPIRILYYNVSRTDSTGATIRIHVPGSLGFTNLPPNCTSQGTTATCVVGPVLAPPSVTGPTVSSFTVETILPNVSGATYEVETTIEGNEPDPVANGNHHLAALTTYLAHFVTNTNDSGPGSLREAIHTVNASPCARLEPCQIAFRIASDEPVKTIAPRTPLPRITAANVSIDATTQTRGPGDTNSLGPEIEISGALQNGGNGFELMPACAGELRGFAINGFANYGVVLGDSSCSEWGQRRALTANYIGTDATGTRAIPNERGVLIDMGMTSQPWIVAGNVISGNRRAGVWVEAGMVNAIQGNTIGLTATRTAALGNGASGVFINERGYGTDVLENYIGFNAHAGVSIARKAQYVAVYANSIQANGQGAIDWYLDGATPNAEVDAPVILSAQYDAASNTTLIRGTVDARGTFDPDVFIHASDAPDAGGFGEGQYHLGSVRKQGAFEFRAVGDWRGKWISANARRNLYVGWLVAGPVTGNGSWQGFLTTTSEFGNALKVE